MLGVIGMFAILKYAPYWKYGKRQEYNPTNAIKFNGSPPSADFADIGSSGKPNICVAFLIKVLFSVVYVRVLVAIFFGFPSMEIKSSAISDLQPFVRWWDLLPKVNGGVERLQLSRYGCSDFASPDRFWIFSHGFRKEDYPRSFLSRLLYPRKW
jgi:hypothetical protein